jgi:hypothetical protein
MPGKYIFPGAKMSEKLNRNNSIIYGIVLDISDFKFLLSDFQSFSLKNSIIFL